PQDRRQLYQRLIVPSLIAETVGQARGNAQLQGGFVLVERDLFLLPPAVEKSELRRQSFGVPVRRCRLSRIAGGGRQLCDEEPPRQLVGFLAERTRQHFQHFGRSTGARSHSSVGQSQVWIDRGAGLRAHRLPFRDRNARGTPLV